MTLLQSWPILLGWPAVGLSLILSVTGISRRKPTLLVMATVLVIPMGLYLAMNPRPGWIALIFPVVLALASLAVRWQFIRLAWILLFLFLGMAVFLAYRLVGL